MSTSKKTTETGSSTQNIVSTPTAPDWATGGLQSLAGQLGGLSGQDPQSFFAGPQSILQSLFSGAQGQLAGGPSPYIGQAADMAAGAGSPTDVAQAQAQTAYGGIGNYVNPHESTVINNAMMDMDRARQLTLNQNGQGAIASGQYGGSRQGVLDANANDGFLRSLGNMAGQLRHQGFTTAAGFADSDAGRAQQASMFNADAQNQAAQAAAQRQLSAAGLMGQLGQASGQEARANMGMLGDIGGMQQGLAQQQAGAPLSVLQALSGTYGQLPWNMVTGQNSTATGTSTGTTTQKGSFLDGLGGVMMGVGGLGSGFNGFGLFGGK